MVVFRGDLPHQSTPSPPRAGHWLVMSRYRRAFTTTTEILPCTLTSGAAHSWGVTRVVVLI